jgi:phosphoglycerate dehydrogenase-like enzyme
LLGDDMLARLKPSAGVINVGRAHVLDLAALASRLERGLLAGAVLDSYAEEPLPPGSPLWQTPNLIMLPHIAAGSGDSFLANALDIFFRNAARLRHGDMLENVVDAERGY